MFGRILIANRGEIASRVAHSCRRLGIQAVAVYSDADRDARHVGLADAAYRIGGARASESYLDGEAILAAAAASGAEAIHPGYGFLSENAGFAEACAARGLVFIGPPPAAIRSMGEKSTAKDLMKNAGVPLVPGWYEDGASAESLAEVAAGIGYPVLIKAVAGGGGKGMRIVHTAAELPAALAGAAREAEAAFGDPRVMLEKYLASARHIEVQVFGDRFGNVIHLFERDCSAQRRYQKVIEEAPAVGLSVATRQALGAAAVKAAQAVGYVGAGTVEFLVASGWAQDDKENPFYFLEMNTRLQVEHPVTEAITGLDLVEWQLRVASGEALPLAQDQVEVRGHAIEARLYAENPARDFLPATGPLLRFRRPPLESHVRLDTGVREGDTVTPHYDPMLAKLIVWGEDRAAAVRRLEAALDQWEIAGPETNHGFLRRLARHADFVAGGFDTGFLGRVMEALLPLPADLGGDGLALAVLGECLSFAEAAAAAARAGADPFSPWAAADGWRLNGAARMILRFRQGETEFAVAAAPEGEGYRLGLPAGAVAARGRFVEPGTLMAEIGGKRHRVGWFRQGREIVVAAPGWTYRLGIVDPLAGAVAEEETEGGVSAPLPGRVIEVLVAPGAEVAKGDPLIVLSAMKVEHTLVAPGPGKLARVLARPGDQVEEGTLLIAFAEPE